MRLRDQVAAQMLCTVKECNRPTGSLFLCDWCIRDLDRWIEKARELAPELTVTISRQDRLRRPGFTGSTAGTPAAPAAMNIDAWQLQRNIFSIDRDAARYAADPYAAGISETIQGWCERAELLISGPRPERPDLDGVRERVRKEAPAMPTRRLLPWLRENAGITIRSTDVRNWVRRGFLHPAARAPEPTYYPHEVLAARRRRSP